MTLPYRRVGVGCVLKGPPLERSVVTFPSPSKVVSRSPGRAAAGFAVAMTITAAPTSASQDLRGSCAGIGTSFVGGPLYQGSFGHSADVPGQRLNLRYVWRSSSINGTLLPV